MAFTNPENNLSELGLSDGMTVADLGAGIGEYSLLASKLVGSGKVYAFDIQNTLLLKLKKEAEHKNLSNIEIIRVDLEKERGTPLKDNSVDALIISNTLFLVEKKDVLIVEAKRILRQSGKALVIDWADSFGGLGPQPENVFLEDKAHKLFKDNGFEIEKVLFDAGEHHYGFVARLKNNH